MPLARDGSLYSVLSGDTDQERLVNKIREMRKELVHLDRVMASMELQARRGVQLDHQPPQELLPDRAKVAYGRDFMLLVVNDLRKKLQMFGF